MRLLVPWFVLWTSNSLMPWETMSRMFSWKTWRWPTKGTDWSVCNGTATAFGTVNVHVALQVLCSTMFCEAFKKKTRRWWTRAFCRAGLSKLFGQLLTLLLFGCFWMLAARLADDEEEPDSPLLSCKAGLQERVTILIEPPDESHWWTLAHFSVSLPGRTRWLQNDVPHWIQGWQMWSAQKLL